ncbi:transporter substrate-binding domain-containing protein [Pseudoduganella sp. DS3]|uniref:Transporter substrate-binding domain-containing protein n=1 Tax=Pseudoduganella guangdongensis TaxID=2692179 RepID=A0A6N9HEB5_9BURK|nr:transporter substrate-binding domain-containing protein [Pseudoduganella guangdongensis]MYN01587.1 transporter substrate-binding domain-containing protein [Pseudoduganella guangdongensis]
MKVIYQLLLALLTMGPAQASQLVVLVDTSTEMPLADIDDAQLRGGIHRDLAQALARKLNRQLVVQVLPRKRIAQALETGRGDLLCLYLPEWLPGHFQWTQPFFPQTELLVSALAAARPQSLSDLAGKPVGTVLGYTYPEFEAALGRRFQRIDVTTNAINLRKLAVGRIHYVATIKAFYDYQLRKGEKLNAHKPLLIKQYLTRCALSSKSSVALADVDHAISQLVAEGTISKILSDYQ